MDVTAEIAHAAVFDPRETALAVQRLCQARGIELQRHTVARQLPDVRRRIALGVRKDDLYILQIQQMIQRVPDRRRPRIKRHLEQKLVRALAAQAVQTRKPLHPVADEHLRTEANLRRPFRQMRTQQLRALCPAAQEGLRRFPVRVKMRRRADCSDAGRGRHIQLPQGRLKPIAPMVTAGQHMRMVVQRQVDRAVTALHRDRNMNTYIRTCRSICTYTYGHIFRTSYSYR